MIYSHNSIGLGHTFRMLAILTGIKRWRPDIDFIAVSGTSVPHVFLRHGIEVIKLPSIKKIIAEDDNSLTPRYLHDTNIHDVLEYRKKTIAGAFEFFRPDALMIEHYISGLSGEIIPLLEKKKASIGTPDEFLLVNISRGIMGSVQQEKKVLHRPSAEDYINLYDLIYVFDDRGIAGINAELPGDVPSLESKISYAGRITDKHIDEIQTPDKVLKRLRLSGKPVILMNLSRHGAIGRLSRQLMSSLHRTGLSSRFQIVMVIDPYLESSILEEIQNNPIFEQVRFLPFFYPLIDLIQASELVICRAGYNIVNELLLTDAKALVIPEHHKSEEQERRAALIPRDNIAVMSEQDVLSSPPDSIILGLLNRKTVPLHFNFDKYKIGRNIINDLENRAAGRAH